VVELNDGGRAMSVDGEDVAVFPRAEICEAHGLRPDGDQVWEYTVRQGDGQDFVEISLTVPIAQGDKTELCEMWWSASADSC
jgi:hypothetical protein